MSFCFNPKTERLNWDQLAEADVESIMHNNDISYLEQLLQNITNAELNNDDLQRIGDKNLIKLFKVGQLTMEYM